MAIPNGAPFTSWYAPSVLVLLIAGPRSTLLVNVAKLVWTNAAFPSKPLEVVVRAPTPVRLKKIPVTRFYADGASGS